MTKHTPGPWHRSPTRMGDAYDIDATDNTNVCIVHGAYANGAGYDQHGPNAALIAAAPEMLEALEMARAELRYSISEQSFEATMNTIEAALSKARGET